MPAGYNQIAKLWRYTQDPDDDIGGSVPTGTVLFDNLLVRIEPANPTMALLEQGIETVKIYKTAITYRAKDVRENDVLEVTEPVESWYYGKQFRVIGVQHPSLRPNDPRSQVIITLRRRDDAHTIQF